uniref:G6f-like n=1 Tax=Paramormyrops kingsleyae TaxID=1676925 RepID=A0A3B3T6J0_9TELE|nr:uncharacterized protein LOC111842902 isoform X1 [Paramormyrops kingsleyae]
MDLRFVFLLAVVLLCSHPVIAKDRDVDVIVAMADTTITLPCSNMPLKEKMLINWQWLPHGVDSTRLILSADRRQEFLGMPSRKDARLADSSFWKSGNFSLSIRASAEDGGHYTCLINQAQKTLKEQVMLLIVLTVSADPPLPVPEQSTLRLQAKVSGLSSVLNVSWLSPRGLPLHYEVLPEGGVITKLPNITLADKGDYICKVRLQGNRGRPASLFLYPVTVDGSRAANFNHNTYSAQISKACLSYTPVSLPCPPVSGDYVLLYWQHPDKRKEIELVFSYDRWRRRVRNVTKSNLRISLCDSARQGELGFVLTPRPEHGGVFICEVFQDDNVYSQSLRLSVLHVAAQTRLSVAYLTCRYSERMQVRVVTWTHQYPNRSLNWYSKTPGAIITEVQLPPRPETAGNYTCTLELNNGEKIDTVHVVRLASDESPIPSPSPSLPSSHSSPFPYLSILGVLLPVVAVAIGVLLWKLRAHKACPGIEQSLSHHSGEVENIYENPEDLRQAQSSIYMDLKPTSQDDVYRELDRYEHRPY